MNPDKAAWLIGLATRGDVEAALHPFKFRLPTGAPSIWCHYVIPWEATTP
jgi:hypothetical protein